MDSRTPPTSSPRSSTAAMSSAPERPSLRCRNPIARCCSCWEQRCRSYAGACFVDSAEVTKLVHGRFALSIASCEHRVAVCVQNKAQPKRRKSGGAVVQPINSRRTYQRAYDAFCEDNDPGQALSLLQRIEAQGHLSIEAMSSWWRVPSRAAVAAAAARSSKFASSNPQVTLSI